MLSSVRDLLESKEAYWVACAAIVIAPLLFIWNAVDYAKQIHTLAYGRRVEATVVAKHARTRGRHQLPPKLRVQYMLDGETKNWVFDATDDLYRRTAMRDQILIAVHPTEPQGAQIVALGSNPLPLIFSGTCSALAAWFLIARRRFLLRVYGVTFNPPLRDW